MKKKFYKALIICLVAALSFTVLAANGLFAHAGMSDVTIAADSTFEGEIGKAYWYYTDGVTGESNAIVFGAGSNEDSRILSRAKADDVGDYGRAVAIEADIGLSISSLAEGERFMIGFGMRSAAAKLASASSTTVYFTNVGGTLHCGVFKTDAEGKEITVCDAAAFTGNTLGARITLQTDISSDGGIKVDVNGTVICDKSDAGVYFVGYFGFGQTAESSAKITNCSVVSGAYDRPETPAASVADFADDEFNINEWYTMMSPGYYSPSTMNVSNGMLNFVNTGQSSICTMHQYSNFEFTFDMPYLQVTTEYSDSGEIIKPHSYWWGISFGCPSYEGWANNMVTNAHCIGFQPSTGYDATATDIKTHVAYENHGTSLGWKEITGKYNFWDPANEGNQYNFKLSVIDGVVKLDMKCADETEWYNVFDVEVGDTPLGYVGILAMGHTAAEGVNMVESGTQYNITVANFSLDNLRVENKDQNAQIIEVPYKGNRLDIPADYAYSNTWSDSDLLVGKLESGEITAPERTLWPWMIAIGAGGVCVMAAITVTTFVLIRKREKKG